MPNSAFLRSLAMIAVMTAGACGFVAALSAAGALGDPPPTCHGDPIIDYTFRGYDGPTRIVSCGRFVYNAGRLVIDAYDPDADGLFRNGFEAVQP